MRQIREEKIYVHEMALTRSYAEIHQALEIIAFEKCTQDCILIQIANGMHKKMSSSNDIERCDAMKKNEANFFFHQAEGDKLHSLPSIPIFDITISIISCADVQTLLHSLLDQVYVSRIAI